MPAILGENGRRGKGDWRLETGDYEQFKRQSPISSLQSLGLASAAVIAPIAEIFHLLGQRLADEDGAQFLPLS